MMLQGMHRKSNGSYKVDSLIEAAFDYAKECLLRDDEGNLKERQVSIGEGQGSLQGLNFGGKCSKTAGLVAQTI